MMSRTSYNRNSDSVPAHALYGQPANSSRQSLITDSRIAPPSRPYVGRGNKCSAKNDTCEGNRVQGHDLCAGHLRSAGVKLKSKDVVEQDGE
jgi:hypothetical protein